MILIMVLVILIKLVIQITSVREALSLKKRPLADYARKPMLFMQLTCISLVILAGLSAFGSRNLKV